MQARLTSPRSKPRPRTSRSIWEKGKGSQVAEYTVLSNIEGAQSTIASRMYLFLHSQGKLGVLASEVQARGGASLEAALTNCFGLTSKCYCARQLMEPKMAHQVEIRSYSAASDNTLSRLQSSVEISLTLWMPASACK